MELWLESSTRELFDWAVEAFPQTSRRQNATHSVRVEHIDWIPFEGVETLFVKALVNNEGRKNDSIILFKGVKYRGSEGRGTVSIKASDGREVHLEPLSLEENDVMVRCTCRDFRWRFAHWNRVDGSLYGRGPGKYEAAVRPGSSNPSGSPGMCKHLMKMAKILRESGGLVQSPGRN